MPVVAFSAASIRKLAVVVLALATMLLTTTLSTPAATAEETAPAAVLPETVSADALPTVQIDDGVVWTQAIAGDTVFVGGQFSNARPAGAAKGTNLTPRGNMLAYQLSTGRLITSFNYSFNGRVSDMTVSPDGKRLYVIGPFTAVNGQTRNRIAIFDLPGATLSALAPNINGTTQSVAATNDTVFVGGYFSAVNGTSRARIAAIDATNGRTRPFRPIVDNGQVQSLVVSPDGTKVVLGGDFTSVEGKSDPGYGLAMVDAVTGVSLPMPVNSVIRNAGPSSGILSLTGDNNNFYGAGWHNGPGGNLEGSFAARWSDAGLVWVEDCHGDTYEVSSVGNLVYQASHKHYCGNSGGFPQTEPWSFYHSTVLTKTVEGTNTNDIYGYPDHPGRPRPAMLNWYPQTDIGTFTGKNQAAWTVTGNDKYVVYGGEFPKVNGTPQYGLVRYAIRSIAPNDEGPVLSDRSFAPTVSSYASGRVRVSFTTNYDRDDDTLTYRVYRDSENNAPLLEKTITTPFWKPVITNVPDEGLTPGSTHQYRVTATDPSGNTTRSSWVDVQVSDRPASPYVDSVVNDGASNYWRFSEPSGSRVTDWAGNAPLAAEAGVTRGVAGALAGDTDPAASFSGVAGGLASTATAVPGPVQFSVEAFFRTTTTSGGKIVGFGNSRTGTSGSYDRHIYMGNDGRVSFGVYNGSTVTVTSPNRYNDNQWHHVVGTLSSTGITFYVDGKLVGTRTDVSSAQQFDGFWRVGGDNLNGWPEDPSSDWFQGAVDEVAVYPNVLTAQQVQAHMDRSQQVTAPNAAPVAKFTSTVTARSVALDASTSTDSDGTVASYAWDFGDGEVGTGQKVTHEFDTSGTYPVKLTVTDDKGATGTVTTEVTVSAPANVAPVAKFQNSVSGLSVAVDASTSTDSDGTVASYAWNFGDGEVGTGRTTSHDYDAAGTYTVRLTVTDDKGATGTVTSQVTVTAPPKGVLAADSFERTASSGWGPAETGGSWLPRGNASRFSVSGGVGVVAAPAGSTSTVDLPDVSSSSARVTTEFSVERVVEATYVTLVGRRIAADEYQGRLRIAANGSVRLYLLQNGSGVASSQVLPGVTIEAGKTYKLSLDVAGTSPTRLSAKVWDASGAEPAWQVTGTNTFAALQAPGAVGVLTYLPSAAGSTVRIRFDDFEVIDPAQAGQAPANVAPVARFQRSLSGLSVSLDASTSTDSDGTVASYAWDFGDGEVGTGRTTSHDYDEAGTYTIKLTVTDDDGATGVTSTQTTVLQPAAGVLAADSFERTATSGWGAAGTGGRWLPRNNPGRFSVADGVGVVAAPAGSTSTVDLPDVSSSSARVTTEFSVDRVVEATYVTLVGRRVGTDEYQARLRIAANGSARVYLLQNGTSVAASTVVTGLTIEAGKTYKLSLDVAGTSPTRLSAKVWDPSGTEPAWQVTGTGSLAALQAQGAVGVLVYVPGAAGTPVKVSFDDFVVEDSSAG